MKLVIVILFISCLGAKAATITAASSSYTDVNTAVNTTASAGDTVLIPDGTSTWSSTLTISKAITLKAQNDPTLNSSNRASVCNVKITGGASPVIAISPASGQPSIIIDGLSINGGVNNDGFHINEISSSTKYTNYVIRYCIITNCSAASANGISFSDPNFGLVHHCTLANNQIHLRCLGNSGASWSNFPASPGDANKPYIEDCDFIQTTTASSFISESGQGGRFVIRFCNIGLNIAAGFWEIHDMHGNNGSVLADDRGTVEFEVYNNTYQLSSSIDRIFNYRGGSGKIFNNTVTIGGSLSFEMTEYDGWSYCDWVNKPNYPSDDPVTDAFIFGNTKDGSAFNTPTLANPGPCACGECDDFFIQLNRDYFTPTSGVEASRPGSSTEGTYYAATDTRKIYKWHTGAWTTTYAALTYPHPLQGGGGGGTTGGGASYSSFVGGNVAGKGTVIFK